jgi:hypothetical protein
MGEMGTGGNRVSICHEHPPSCYLVVVANVANAASGWEGQSHFKWFPDEGAWVVAHESGMTMRWPQQGEETPAAFLREAMPDQDLHWIAEEIERIGVPPRAEN